MVERDSTGSKANRIGASLTLKGVCKDYASVAAVRDVNLDIAGGEFVTLLGASGSGKTTTLMMIAGFAEPSSGDILLNDRSVKGLSPAQRDLGVVFQSYSLFPHLTVSQNISFPLEMRGMGKSERLRLVHDILEMVHLPDKADSYPRQLSGGQQQRVALARALVFSPGALLMDEPLGALDKKLRESMQLEIKRIQRDLGATVVYVTHDQEEALTMSDRVAVMGDGRIIQIGKPADLYERPATRWVAEFIGQSNFLEGKVERHDAYNLIAVRLETGEVALAHSSEQPPIGTPVTIVLRPEKAITVKDAADLQASANHVSGTIVEIVYLGHATRSTIALVNGSRITVQEANRGCAMQPDLGSKVHLTWAPQDGWILPVNEAQH